MKFLNKIKGRTLKNRAIMGIIFVGLGGSLIVSAYIKLPQ